MSEAVKLREELRDRLRGADYRQVAVPRLAEFAESWMKSRALALKASTGRTYADLLDHHVVPSLGDFFVDKVTDADVRDWREAIVKTRSAATANNALLVLKMVYRDAVEEYDLEQMPPARVRVLPVQGYTEADPNVLAPAQLAALLTAYKEIAARQYPLALTLALTGLRYGEATALKWTDVDRGGGMHQVRRAQWHGKVSTTKTGVIRSVPLVPGLAKVLREHRRRAVAGTSGAGPGSGLDLHDA